MSALTLLQRGMENKTNKQLKIEVMVIWRWIKHSADVPQSQESKPLCVKSDNVCSQAIRSSLWRFTTLNFSACFCWKETVFTWVFIFLSDRPRDVCGQRANVLLISVGTVVELQEGCCGVEKTPESSLLGNGRETRQQQTSFWSHYYFYTRAYGTFNSTATQTAQEKLCNEAHHHQWKSAVSLRGPWCVTGTDRAGLAAPVNASRVVKV